MTKFKKLRLRIPGDPIAQARARATSIGGKARVYNPRNGAAWRKKVQIQTVARQEYRFSPYDGPVQVSCKFVFKRPKYHHVARDPKRSVRSKYQMAYHIVKPDFDNLEKLVCDALTGIVWKDDAQIINGKEYGDEPYTEIIITFLEQEGESL